MKPPLCRVCGVAAWQHVCSVALPKVRAGDTIAVETRGPVGDRRGRTKTLVTLNGKALKSEPAPAKRKRGRPRKAG